MRILHTADWHLGSRLGGHDRTEEQFEQVERIVQIAAEQQVEVLLVAGDVFERRTKLAELTKRLSALLAPHIRRGMHAILVPGNHDDREHFRMMRSLLSLEQGASEHVHAVQTRETLEIDGVQFAILPYPMPEMLEPFRTEVTGATQRHYALSSAYANLVRAVVASLDAAKPAVFVAHITVAGVKTPSDRELTYDEDMRLGTEDLPNAANIAYIALGHIHQPQQIPHPIPCWYSGSLDRMNFGEIRDEKCVLLVEVNGLAPATVTRMPLPVTQFHDVHVSSEDVQNFAERYPQSKRAFFRMNLQLHAGDDPLILQRRFREVCPRCIDVKVSPPASAPASEPAASHDDSHDYLKTVTGYLHETFADDPDLPELEKRAKKLIRDVPE